ncbi:MAG: hypothetical protein L3J23_08275 [Flavobacteriaceae bacterium]|nr:hypothetical protein [Flavobacteriaceae bacterium]
MELHRIENLLDKYFDSNTTIKEEDMLKEYFVKNDVPSHLQDYKAMFIYFTQNKKEISSKPIQVKIKKNIWRVNWLMTAVAALLFFVAIYKFLPKSPTDVELKEAQIAFNETQKIFQLIANNLNKGNNAIAYLNEYENTTKKIFKK